MVMPFNYFAIKLYDFIDIRIHFLIMYLYLHAFFRIIDLYSIIKYLYILKFIKYVFLKFVNHKSFLLIKIDC